MRWLPFAALALLVWVGCAEEATDAPAEPNTSDAAQESPAPASDPWEGLVFLRPMASGGAGIWLGHVSKGAVAPLLETESAVPSSPHWVPSVLRIVYLSQPKSVQPKRAAKARLMLIDPVDAGGFIATERTGWQEGVASVSPDGKKIAYSFIAPAGQNPERGIRLLDPMSSKDEVLAPVPGAVAFPALDFAPEPNWVVVQVHRTGRGDDIWLLEGTQSARALSENPRWRDANPRYTHQGDRLVFGRSPYPPVEAGAEPARLGGGDICVLYLELRQVQCPQKTADAREFGAVPSPTADELVFVRERDGEVDLFLSDLQGRNERRLTQTPETERAAVWSPDGQRIVFEVGPPEDRRVRVVDREGKLLFDQPGFAPDWTPPLL